MNRPKKIGTEWETRLVRYLAEQGLTVRRNPPAGTNDIGDITVTDADGDSWVIEAKATKAIDLAGGMNELAREKANAGVSFGALVIKRRNHDTGRAYVVIELEDFAALMAPEGGL